MRNLYAELAEHAPRLVQVDNQGQSPFATALNSAGAREKKDFVKEMAYSAENHGKSDLDEPEGRLATLVALHDLKGADAAEAWSYLSPEQLDDLRKTPDQFTKDLLPWLKYKAVPFTEQTGDPKVATGVLESAMNTQSTPEKVAAFEIAAKALSTFTDEDRARVLGMMKKVLETDPVGIVSSLRGKPGGGAALSDFCKAMIMPAIPGIGDRNLDLDPEKVSTIVKHENIQYLAELFKKFANGPTGQAEKSAAFLAAPTCSSTSKKSWGEDGRERPNADNLFFLLGCFVAGAQSEAQDAKFKLTNEVVTTAGVISAIKDIAKDSRKLNWGSGTKQVSGVAAPALLVLIGLAARKHFRDVSSETRETAAWMYDQFSLNNLSPTARTHAWSEFERAIEFSKGRYR